MDSLRTEIGRLRSHPSGENIKAAAHMPSAAAEASAHAAAKKAKLTELVELAMEAGGAVVSGGRGYSGQIEER